MMSMGKNLSEWVWKPSRGMLLLCAAAFTLLGTGSVHASVWYVDIGNISGTEDGTSWATAFTTIQLAIDAAEADQGGEVWVAEGTYDEARTSPNADGSNEDTGSVVLKSGVDVYGGFAGGETVRIERNWETNVTILDGSASRNSGPLPAYHVVVGAARFRQHH